METIAPYVKSFWQYFTALCSILIDSVANSFLTAAESFDKQDTRMYKASFGDVREILDPWHHGFCLNGTACLTRKMSYEGVLVIGPIGSGKGINIIIPNMIRLAGNSTLILHDPSGEAMEKTSGFLKKQGYKIYVLNWSDPAHSDSYNILFYVKNKSDAYKVASILVESTLGKDSRDPFWSLQSVTLLYCFIAIVMTQPEPLRTMTNVKHLLVQFSIDPKKIDPLFIRFASDELMRDYQSIIVMEDKVLKSVIATSLAALGLWFDDNISRGTAINTIDLYKIRREPTAIFVLNHTTDAKIYSPLINIFFEQLMAILFAELPDPKRDLDVAFVMDEASSIFLKSLPTILNNSRKYRLAFLLAYQSNQQIHAAYGADAESIKSALRTKVWLSGLGMESKELEELLGRKEVLDSQGKIKIKPLMLSEEIRQMRADEGLILSPSGRPYKTTMTPYFKQSFFNLKTKYPPVRCVNSLVPVHVPLTPFNEKAKTK